MDYWEEAKKVDRERIRLCNQRLADLKTRGARFLFLHTVEDLAPQLKGELVGETPDDLVLRVPASILYVRKGDIVSIKMVSEIPDAAPIRKLAGKVPRRK